MIEGNRTSEIKLCCATFYQSDLARILLGDILHPGGLELTGYLGTITELKSEDKVLDIACGRGASVVYLAKRFGCHVTGLDYGQDNVSAAQNQASLENISHLTAFSKGDAEGLPFEDESYNVVISECSFCTFPDKEKAAQEMVRVLRGHGRLGMTDVTVSCPLPEDIQSLLGWVACVTGAGSPEFYISILNEVGFADFVVEDKRESLLKMVNDLRHKLLGIEMGVSLGKLNLGDFDLSEVKSQAQRALELIQNGAVSYTLFKAHKK